MNRVPSSHRLMGCTIEELLHWLPAASNGSLFRVNQVSDMTNQWQIDFPKEGIHIIARVEPSRKIALLVIPVLAVNFYFEDSWDLSARDEWMKRFDMYIQRGGG